MVSQKRQTREPQGAKGARVLVVEARFYDDIADHLLEGVRAVLDAAGTETTVVTVPGALELPTVLEILIEAARHAGKPYEAAVVLGCVIRGETGHYDIVAGESARALIDLSVAHRLPLGNGILTVENRDQALARARATEMDKGGGAAQAALAILSIKRRAGEIVGEEHPR